MYLIDEPTPFAGLEAWRTFLAELEAEIAINPAPELIDAAERAREMIAKKEADGA